MEERGGALGNTSGQALKDIVRQALELDKPYDAWFLPRHGRRAAVLILLGHPPAAKSSVEEASVLLTKRTEQVETHKGQIAFPGGVQDPEDETEEHTALRETYEEVGLLPEEVDCLGRMPVAWARTGFLITPVVGVLRRPIDEVSLCLNRSEIAEAFWVPLRHFWDRSGCCQQSIEHEGRTYLLDAYQVGAYRLWGVTWGILKNLLDRMMEVCDRAEVCDHEKNRTVSQIMARRNQ